jgi:hypothetical protein
MTGISGGVVVALSVSFFCHAASISSAASTMRDGAHMIAFFSGRSISSCGGRRGYQAREEPRHEPAESGLDR